MKDPDLSEWHLVIYRDMIVMSVSVRPEAQELQPMMFKQLKVDLFCVPERGTYLGVGGGGPKTGSLERAGNDP